MTHPRLIAILSLLLSTAWTSVAHSQRALELSAGAGPVFSPGTYVGFGQVGFDVHAGLGTRLVGTDFGLRLEAAHAWLSNLGIRDDNGAIQTASSLTLNGIYTPRLNRSPLRPYLISGIGKYWMDEPGGMRQHFGVNGGAGAWITSADLLWFIELRVHRTAGTTSELWLPVTIGVNF